MTKTANTLEGTVLVPSTQIAELVQKATLLPPAYFVTVGKAKIDSQTGDMTCKYTASTVGPPPAPVNGNGR